jgi:GT2 family glycosyltransferase
MRIFRNDTKTKVSIITPVYCPNHHLLDLTEKLFLESLAKSSMRKDLEVIIIDDASPKKNELKYLVEKIATEKDLNVRIVRNEINQGFAVSVNIGVKNSNSPYLLITNNDIYAPEKSIQRLLALIESNKKYGAIGPLLSFAKGHKMQEMNTGIILNYLNNNEYKKIETVARHISKIYDGKILYTNWLVGCFLLIPRSVFEIVGIFDENYRLGYLEENDFLVRVKKHGYKLVIDKSVLVFHGDIGIRSSSFGSSMSTVKTKAMYSFIRNCVYFTFKNGLKDILSLANTYKIFYF